MPGRLTDEEWRQRLRVHSEVAKAIRTGILVRTGKCSICDSTLRVQFHHHDYSKPLEVVELCKLHHMEQHRILKTYAFKKQFPRTY